ncbi:hypothetical protein V6N13_080464 [Hibiscus sabdariffa]
MKKNPKLKVNKGSLFPFSLSSSFSPSKTFSSSWGFFLLYQLLCHRLPFLNKTWGIQLSLCSGFVFLFSGEVGVFGGSQKCFLLDVEC